MRLKYALKNLITAWTGQFLLILVKFVTRMLFARYLDAVYLGIDGIFTNIISVLSLAELGVGRAISYSLYKPLADNNIPLLKSLMQYYKKLYQIMGMAIGVIGICLTPFLFYLSEDLPDIPNLKFIFLLYVLNTVLSYFCSYRTSLLNADQKKYIYLSNHYIFYILMNLTQIIILYFTQNFFLFIAFQTLFTMAENLNIAYIAGKKYPFLKDKEIIQLGSKNRTEIWSNTKNITLGRIGNTIINTSDTLILAKLFGTVSVGVYSNYLLVISSLTAILRQFVDAILPSIGNLYAKEEREKTIRIFYVTNFLNAWIYVFASICLYCLIQPFIFAWLGGSFLMPFPVVAVLILRFFIQGMRDTVCIYREGMGLFRSERWKNLAEALLNIVFSIGLVGKFGIIGVFAGTVISAAVVGIWVEVRELYNNGFLEPQRHYYIRYAAYAAVGLFAGNITAILCGLIEGSAYIKIVGRLLICLVVPNTIWILVWFRSSTFQFLLGVVKTLFKNRSKR